MVCKGREGEHKYICVTAASSNLNLYLKEQ